MNIDKVYPPQSEGQHVGRILADFLLWCRRRDMPAKEIVETAATRVGLHPSDGWIQGTEVWSWLASPVGDSNPLAERRAEIFEQVVKDQEAAIAVLCKLIPSPDFAACAEMAEVLFCRACGHVPAASDEE